MLLLMLFSFLNMLQCDVFSCVCVCVCVCVRVRYCSNIAAFYLHELLPFYFKV